MRIPILIAALALASCGGNEQADNTAVTEGTSADQVTAVNDATAIDAATGQAADMAADVNYTFNEIDANDLASDAANVASNAGR